MRLRLSLVGLLVVGAAISAGVGASAGPPRPAVTCSLPGMVFCTEDTVCAPFGATCDTLQGACVCSGADLGTGDGGSSTSDLAATDLAGTTTPPGTTGAAGPPVGGGMSSPPRSGCSFVPGRAL